MQYQFETETLAMSEFLDSSIDECQRLIHTSETLLKSDEAEECFDQIEENIEDAESEIQSIRIEIRSAAKSIQKQHSQTIDDLKGSLKVLKKSFEAKRFEHKRAELGLNVRTSSEDGETKGLLHTQQATAALEGARRTLFNTEDQGADILNDLRTQRKTLQRAKQNLQEGTGISYQLKNILRGMETRHNLQKLAVKFAGTIFCLFILIILYLKIR